MWTELCWLIWMVLVQQSSASAQHVSMCGTWQTDSILPVMWICVQGQAVTHSPYFRCVFQSFCSVCFSSHHWWHPQIRPLGNMSSNSGLLCKLPRGYLKILCQIQIQAKWREGIKTFWMLVVFLRVFSILFPTELNSFWFWCITFLWVVHLWLAQD